MFMDYQGHTNIRDMYTLIKNQHKLSQFHSFVKEVGSKKLSSPPKICKL